MWVAWSGAGDQAAGDRATTGYLCSRSNRSFCPPCRMQVQLHTYKEFQPIEKKIVGEGRQAAGARAGSSRLGQPCRSADSPSLRQL